MSRRVWIAIALLAALAMFALAVVTARSDHADAPKSVVAPDKPAPTANPKAAPVEADAKATASATLRIACETRLAPVLEAVAAEVKASHGLSATLNFDDTESLLGALANAPAPPDVLIVEGKDAMAVAIRRGLVAKEDVITLASDRLVLAVQAGAQPSDPIKYLESLKPGRLALPDPDATLEGVHAIEALKRLGLYKKMHLRYKSYPGSRQVVAAVAEDKADAGMAYLSNVIQNPAVVSGMTFPKMSVLPLLYFGAPIRLSANKASGLSFLLRLAGPKSGKAWMAAGFSPPPEGMP